nr:InlB B-repeat-containing protein [uncultured Acetobacterium sp.]
MRFLKNLALFLSLILVLNTILPQALVFAQETNISENVTTAVATVSVAVVSGGNGTVAGGGNYTSGTIATITATPNTGYLFSKWTDANGNTVSTEASYLFTVSNNVTYKANFVKSVQVTNRMNPIFGSMEISGENGQTGSGAYPMGSTIIVTVTPAPGFTVAYIEAGFNNGTYYQYAYNTSTATFVVNDDVDLLVSVNNISYQITVESSNTALGTVANTSGTYSYGQNVSLSAYPAPGYTCISYSFTWGNDSIWYQYSGPISVPITQSGTYQLFFQPQTYTLTVTSDGNGNVTGGGAFEYGSTHVITATPNPGYQFSKWTDANGNTVSTAANYQMTVSGNANYTANFTMTAANIQVSGSPSAGGTVTGNGLYNLGSAVTLTATPATGYQFKQWINAATQAVVSNSSSYTFSASTSTAGQYTAIFTPQTYTISTATNPPQAGTAVVTSAATVAYGDTATVLATPGAGYTFAKWVDSDTGQTVSTMASYSFNPVKNTRLIANFTQSKYTLSLTANPSAGGTVSSNTTNNLIYGQTVAIQATPADGYVFNGWVDPSGNSISTNASYNLAITGNMSLTANFSAIEYPVAVTVSPDGGGTATGGGSFVNGAQVTLSATPGANYNFVRWTQAGSNLAVSTNPQYTFTASAATQGNYTAVFALKTFSVNFKLDAQAAVANQVTITPTSGIFSYGSVVAVNAAIPIANPTIHFLGWYENGRLVSKTQAFNYTVTQNANLSAVFVTDYGAIIYYGDPIAAQKSKVVIAPMNTTKTITAATSSFYDFAYWTDTAGNQYPQTTLDATVGPDWVESYVAHYIPKTFTVAVAGQTPGGTATTSLNSIQYGQEVTVTATPDTGYAFLNWTDSVTGTVLSTDASWTFEPSQNTSLQANFSQIVYTVGLNADPDGGGTVAWGDYPNAGPYYGTVITAIATPAQNYVFDGWINAQGICVSTDNSYDYTVIGNDTLTGQFHVSQNTITAIAEPANMGTVTGGGTFAYKTQQTLSAIPNTGFEFVNWTNNLDDTVVTTPEMVVNVSEDIMYTANFDVLKCPVTLSVIDPARSTYGTVELDVYQNGVLAPSGTIPNYGDKVVLTATTNPAVTNVIFKDYLDGAGALLSYNSVYTIDAMTQPMAIQYDFVQEYTVTVPVSAKWTDNYQRNLLPGVVPQVTQFPNQQVSGNFKDTITLNYGTVDANLVFDGWYTDEETPVLVSSEPSFSYQLLDSTPLVAKLHLKDIGIMVENAYVPNQAISGVDLNGGEVSGSGYRNVGESFNISSTVDTNYSFENWTQGGTTLSKKASFDYPVTGQPGIDATPIQANYSPNACYLTLNANPKGSGQAAPSGYYPYGTLVTISQGNQAGYVFSHFEDGNGNTLTSMTPNSKAGTLTLYMTGDTTVVAVYKESAGSEAKKIVEIIAAAATAAAIAAGIAAAIYFGGDELLADAALDTAEVALEDLGELAGGVVDHNPPDPDPDPDNPDDQTDILITATASPADAGTAIGGETYRVGEMAVLKATANPGWVFDSWTSEGAVVIDDPEAKSISFLVDEADEGSVLTAHFNQEFTITTSATPEIGGTVTPTKKVVSGETAIVTATPNEGYLFDGWYENEVQVSTEESYTLEAVATDHNLTAQFEAGFDVTLTADPVAMDTLVTFTGAGLSKTGEHTITATLLNTEVENYVFNGWYVNLTDLAPVSTEESYTFALTADTSYIASYSEQYTIITSATPEAGGTVTPTQQVTIGNDATVTATPNEGYVFDGWYEGEAQVSEDESYTLTAVAADHNLTAQFELGANVTLTADPTTMDTLVTFTGDGLAQTGEHTITATLDDADTDNYIFKGWFSALTDDVPASTSETYTFDLTADTSYIASYEENAFTVTAESEDAAQGTVTQTGTSPYKLSDSVTVSATSLKGYSFTNWTDENNAVVSQTADYTFDVTENTTVTANFEAEPSVTILVQCDYVEGGTVTSDDKDIPETGLVATNGESVTLKAEEKKDYEFEGWYENGKEVEKKDTYTFTAEKDRTLVAAFSHKGIMALAFPDPLEGGRVYKVYQTSETKDEFYMNAVPFNGYEFVGWYDIAGIKVCDTPEYDFVAYYSRVLFAKFKLEQFAVNVSITPDGGGTVSGAGTTDYGKAVTLTATPEAGYIFTGFMDATGNLLSSDAVYTFTLRAETDLTASFSPQTYTMTTTVNDPALGSVSNSGPDGVYPAGTAVSLQASPASGSQFVGWFENGQCVSQEPNYTFTATADRNLEADFSNEEFVLTLMADPVTGGTLSGEGGYNPTSDADQASISAVAFPGYSFTAWLDADTGEQVSTLSSDAITLTKDTNLTAVFTPNVYQVDVTVDDGGTATGAGYYNFGDTVNLSASANSGYTFAGWMMTDAQGTQSCISTDLDYTFTLNEDWINLAPITISATFKNTKGALIIPLAEEYLRGNIARGYHLDTIVGNQTTVEAIPGYGYEFTNWTDLKGNVISSDAVYTFTVTGDTVLIAHFKSNATVKLSVTEQSVLQGKAILVGDVIAGEKTVESGQYVMVYAVAYPGYQFLHWVNQNGLKVSNARSYLFRISEDTTLTAVFEKTTHDISANVDPKGAGYVTGQNTYAYGDTATLTAVPTQSGYIFGYWSDENGRIKGAISPVFKTTVNGSKTYTAHFVQGKYSITAKAVPEQGGTVSGGGSFGQEEAVTLTVTPNSGYQFDGWFVAGTSVSTDTSWSFDATESLAAEAHFSVIPLSDIKGPGNPHPGLPHRSTNR